MKRNFQFLGNLLNEEPGAISRCLTKQNYFLELLSFLLIRFGNSKRSVLTFPLTCIFRLKILHYVITKFRPVKCTETA